jgi:hypothetical protein
MRNKVSVILASCFDSGIYLTDSPEREFQTAINSFLKQDHKEKELIIVSFGCDKTNFIYKTVYSDKPEIKLIEIHKCEMNSGLIYEAGIEMATGNIICYLEPKHSLSPDHLSKISAKFSEEFVDWIYWNTITRRNWLELKINKKSLLAGNVGTTSIAHKKSLGLSWLDCNGVDAGVKYVNKLQQYSEAYKKAYGCGYIEKIKLTEKSTRFF